MTWTIGGDSIPGFTGESRTWQTLSLVFVVATADLTSGLRKLDSDAGKVDVVENSDGSFRAVDLSGGSNTYSVTPATDRSPPRTSRDYMVADYSESVKDQAAERYQVNLDLRAKTERTTSSGLSETAGTNEWTFDFHTGTIATADVSTDIGGQGGAGSQSKSLTLVLDNDQARVVEESASHLGAVNNRVVPDGTDVTEDNTSNNRNSVTITSQNQDLLADDTYVVEDWTTEMLSEDWNLVSMSVSPRG